VGWWVGGGHLGRCAPLCGLGATRRAGGTLLALLRWTLRRCVCMCMWVCTPKYAWSSEPRFTVTPSPICVPAARTGCRRRCHPHPPPHQSPHCTPPPPHTHTRPLPPILTPPPSPAVFPSCLTPLLTHPRCPNMFRVPISWAPFHSATHNPLAPSTPPHCRAWQKNTCPRPWSASSATRSRGADPTTSSKSSSGSRTRFCRT
jgi:hypothetical protein